MSNARKLLSFFIILGFLIYFSRGLRADFAGNQNILYWLGFMPNFGLSFAMPLVYVANRINSKNPVSRFNWACLITLLAMILNEIVDKYQPYRVFDWLDILASLVGVVSAYILFHFFLKHKVSN